MIRHLPDADATAAFGALLARTRPPRAVLWLCGDLGAGKSTLARGVLRALGVVGTLRSPTYTLVERYPVAGGEAVHLDLYRLGEAAELDFLGLDELDAVAGLWLVEWPERGGAQLPTADLRLVLSVEGDGRQAAVAALSSVGRAWLARIEGSLGQSELAI